MEEEQKAAFPATVWTVIRFAKDRECDEYCTAMNDLITGYWRPIFYFLRVRGYQIHQAEDLTQEFFLNLMERDWIRRADPARGKFRTFLLTILVRFLSDRGPNRAPKQRKFDERLISVSTLLKEQERDFEPPTNETPETIFMKQWAISTIETVQRKLADWCRDCNRTDWHQVFQANHFQSPGTPTISQTALAEQMGISRDQVRYALEQTNQRFVELLRAEIADQVDFGVDINEELRELEDLLQV